MDEKEQLLWDRIQAYSFDNIDADFPFLKRLARDNNWSLKYSKSVIEEYRKFMFLAIKAGHPVTPSDQVDQAWHLHLLYTEEYWSVFCKKVLHKSFHHQPTKGGLHETKKFKKWYSNTLDSYKKYFQSSPAIKIWPNVEKRFSNAPYFQRINTHGHRLVKVDTLRLLRYALVVILILSLIILLKPTLIFSESSWINMKGNNAYFAAVPSFAIVGILFVTFYIRGMTGKIKVDEDGSNSNSSSGCGGCGGCG